MDKFDAIIVGAGPAGTSAAKILEQQGHKIRIVDKDVFPRNKPCAGVLSPKIRSILDIPKNICERPLQGYRVFSPSVTIIESSFPEEGYIVKREKFDNYLLKRLENEPICTAVKEINNSGDHLEIIGNDWISKTSFVVGADGVNSIVRKKCNIPQKRIATAAQYEIKLSNSEINEKVGNWFEVYYILNYGYGWISPMKNSLKVGIGLVTDHLEGNIWNVLDEFINRDVVKKKCNRGEIINKEGAAIPMAGPLDQVVEDRVLLAGDAGGFVYPGTGEGIYYAVKSGLIAGTIIDLAIKGGKYDKKFLEKHYNKELENNGLLGLRDVDFVEKYLSSSEKAERYVKRLKHIAGGKSVS